MHHMSMLTSRASKHRWSLSLIVIMLLHWTFGACAALADTLCLEPTGQVVWEQSGTPCAADALEQATGKPCVDLQLHDGQDDHSPVPSKLQLADIQAPGLVTALTWLLPAETTTQLQLPAATGPPLAKPLSLIVRETAYLLI